MEIITGVERRRRWRVEDKLRIVAEAEAPDACISHVARRHQVSRGLLTSWRDQVRRGSLVAEPPAVFVPVRMIESAHEAAAASAVPCAAEACGTNRARIGGDRIEITLPDGTCIRIGEDVGLAALRRVIAAVRR